MINMKKFVCIHGHFYQPPRENAWLEVVEKQDSAAPFHDWNERINYECYAPNTAARILDNQKLIKTIVNNYAKISFNIGPTLMTWLEDNDPITYQKILDADKLSMQYFAGYGSALAQVHSHLILPLANKKDQYTQVLWGIKDFEYHFGRLPEGIWLAETAVNTEVLEVLAAQNIRFTILAPRQASAFRKIGEENWSNGFIDTRRPYIYRLPSGKSIVLFFYDGNVAQGVAFEGLLNSGAAFANRLIGTLDNNDAPQMAHIATDGESYGHHHRLGEMALASCLNIIENQENVQLTNYSHFLSLFSPEYEVKIHENTSWSCVHGVERWRSNCGCHAGRGNGKWHQKWRAPLREALNWLRDELIPIYEDEASRLVNDPWAARNDYINVLLNKRSEKSKQDFITQHATRPLSAKDQVRLFRLMEMQRQAMQMFTSCGWFFDEISDIETNQILQYANRAIYYAKQIINIDFHEAFIKKLEQAPSNIFENGAVSYIKNVVPAAVDLERVAMHYAAALLFEENPERLPLFNYEAKNEYFKKVIAGTQRFAVGRTNFKSKVTQSERQFSFAVLYLGQQNIIGNVSPDMPEMEFLNMKSRTLASFKSTDLGEVINIMQQYFKEKAFSIWHLFRDEKRKILKQITDDSLEKAKLAFKNIYDENYQLMLGMQQSEIPIPASYKSIVQYVINTDLQDFFKREKLSNDKLERLIQEIELWKIEITNKRELQFIASERIFQTIYQIIHQHLPHDYIEQLAEIIEKINSIGIDIDFWKSQNLYYSSIQQHKTGEHILDNGNWLAAYTRLGEMLKIKMEV
jgi:alpha-amylase/alpha-mannosidase (GH57 family)